MSPQDEQLTLYERLGGYNAISLFAAHVFRKAFAHPDISHIWAHMPESSFLKEHANFLDFLAKEWGGNVTYRGRSVTETHKGMGLNEAHWNALFECLDQAYEDFKIPTALRQEINHSLYKYKNVVIGSPSYRDVVLSHPEMDTNKGMASVGIIWPKRNS